MENNTVYEWLLQTSFTVAARTKSLLRLVPYLSALVQSGDQILDLCCGSGVVSFWFEAQGARITGMDFAPYMIALAKEEAQRRHSRVEFIQADIFRQDFGRQQFDLISCFGNSISDFPLSDFVRLRNKIAGALKPGGRFVLDYHDASFGPMQGSRVPEGIYQELPERITFRFKEYLPDIGANVTIIRNETRGEEYERKAYVYTVPTILLAMNNVLDLEQHNVVDENHFLDVFAKPASPGVKEGCVR